jgi:predicted RecB family nuclease
MSKYNDYLTASDYYRFLNCPHWPYYERFANAEERKLKRDFTEPELKRMEDGLLHEEDVVEKLFKDEDLQEMEITRDAEADSDATLELMRQGVPIIYQGTITHEQWTGRPDLLTRVEGESSLGEWHYVPVDIKSAHNVSKYHRLQLMFYAVILEHLQGRFPARGYIINKDGDEHEVMLGEHVTEFHHFTAEIERIRAGEKPDPVLRKSCFDVGPWGKLCEHYASSTNDIAQLFNVDVKKLRALRELGIRTIDDAAKMDPIELDGKLSGLREHGLTVAKLQAESLMNQSVIVRDVVALDAPAMEIHFDIESDPPNDTDYLLGVLIRTKDKSEYRPFVAKRLEDEEKMWKEFLAWTETLEEPYQVVHYAPYEHIRLKVLERRYGGSEALDRFRENMIDVKQLLTHSIVLPLYFYGLKYSAPFFGFSWRGDVKSGGQSVDVFEEYLKTMNEDLLNEIILYNEDDVRATAVLTDWLRGYARKLTTFEKPYPWEGGIPTDYKGIN